jgi:hypothetical protein
MPTRTGSPRPVVRRVLPLGGAVEVARSYLKVHVRHGWTGRCRACGDPHPCRDRRDARLVLGGTEPAWGPPGKRIALLALPTVAGLVLIVVAALGLVP